MPDSGIMEANSRVSASSQRELEELPRLDIRMFPHIWADLFAITPFPDLLTLRSLSREHQVAVDRYLSRHVLVHGSGRISSRLAPSARLPRLPQDDGAVASAVRVVDVQSGKFPCATHAADPSAPPHPLRIPRVRCCDCATFGRAPVSVESWYSRACVGQPLGALRVPLVRRWGDHDGCALIHADAAVGYIDPIPRSGDKAAVSLNPAATRIFLLPLPRWATLTAPMLEAASDGRATRIVLRRRTPVPHSEPMAPENIRGFRARAWTIIAKVIAPWFRASIAPENLKVVLVDYEGVPHPTDESKCEKLAYPSRDELIEQIEKAADVEARPHVRKVVVFMSLEEYREDVGEAAFALEEDDHGFQFS